MNDLKLTVDGMHCRSCVMLVQDELEDLGANNVSVKLDELSKKGTVSLVTDKSRADIIKAIESLGEYKVLS
jgi:copper chaperone CopZ